MEKTNERIEMIGVQSLLNQTWLAWKEKIWKLLLIQSVIALPIFAIGVIIADTKYYNDVIEKLFLGNLEKISNGDFSSFFSLWFTIMIIATISSLISGFFTTWTRFAVMKVVIGEKVNSWQAYFTGLDRFVMYILTQLAIFMVVGAGFLFFIIPGIILAVWFSLAEYFVMAEKSNFIQALSNSKRIVEGYWVDVALRMLAMVGIAIAAAIVVSIIKSIFGQIEVIASLLETIFMMLFTSFSLIYFYNIYLDLKKIKG